MLVKGDIWFDLKCGIKKFGDLDVYLNGEGQETELCLKLPVKCVVQHIQDSLIITPDESGDGFLCVVVTDCDDDFAVQSGADTYTFSNPDADISFHFLHCYSSTVYFTVNNIEYVLKIGNNGNKYYADYVRVPHIVFRMLSD